MTDSTCTSETGSDPRPEFGSRRGVARLDAKTRITDFSGQRCVPLELLSKFIQRPLDYTALGDPQ